MALAIDKAQRTWEARNEQRQDRSWAKRTQDERAEIAAIQAGADRTFQIANRPMPAPAPDDTPDRYRARMLQVLLPRDPIPSWLHREPEALDKLETSVAKQAIELARQRPELTPIFEKLPGGAVKTEYVGPKTWMNEFRATALLQVGDDGKPIRIPQVF